MPGQKPPQGIPFDRTSPLFPGVGCYLALNESGGWPVNLATGKPGAGVGVPVWVNGPYGPSLTSLSPTSYVDYPVPYSNGVRWQACLFSNTSTSGNEPWSWASTANDLTFDRLILNFPSAGSITWYLRDDKGAFPAPSGVAVSCNDGLPHVAMTSVDAASNYNVYWDGLLVATKNSTSSFAFTPTQLSLGVDHRSSVTGGFTGYDIAYAYGVGQIPDPWAFAQNWLSGEFRELSPRPDRAIRYFLSAASITATGLVVLGGLAPSASAGLSLTASGSVAFGPHSIAGPSGLAMPATGGVALAGLGDVGTGGLAATASGSVPLGSMIVVGSATGVLPVDATGSVSLGAANVVGAAALSLAATGSATLGALSVAGAASLDMYIAATGVVTLSPIQVAGSVSFSEPTGYRIWVDPSMVTRLTTDDPYDIDPSQVSIVK